MTRRGSCSIESRAVSLLQMPIVEDRRMTGQRVFGFTEITEAEQGQGGKHFRFLESWQHAVHTFERCYRHLAESNCESHGSLQHPHELASWQAVAGDIGDVGHQPAVALDDVDQNSPPISVLGIDLPYSSKLALER